MAMFSKISRYRQQPDVVAVDESGQQRPSKALRPLPDVSGEFIHTIEEIDRLDHLAYKYYRQPRKWWRICDANPEFMSPQALLGKDVMATIRFPLEFDNDLGQPPWAELLAELPRTLGVESIRLIEEESFVEEETEFAGELVTIHAPEYERAIIIAYNQVNVVIDTLVSLIEAAGFDVGAPENIGRVGKQIIIPPDAGGRLK
ncbi:MAG: hypothetical protein GY803_30055 [Chloroflexi bacterium]|nr:hypothetical protein [Chloroflexota bacterium]